MGLLLLAWTFAVESYLRSSGLSTPALVVSLAYVAGDLLLFGCIARTLVGATVRARGFRLVPAAPPSATTGHLASTLWVIGLLLLGAAARFPLAVSRSDPAAAERLTRGRASSFAIVALIGHGFKTVNDTYGHPAGDQLLIGVASRLREVVAGDGAVARLGGDEFAVLVDHTDQAAASALAARIVAALEPQYPVADRLLRVTISVGIAVTGDDATATAALRDADLALYAAKHAGKNSTAMLFDPGFPLLTAA